MIFLESEEGEQKEKGFPSEARIILGKYKTL